MIRLGLFALALVLAVSVHVARAQMPPQSVEDRLDQCTVNLGNTLSQSGQLNFELRKAQERLKVLEAAEKARKDAEAKGKEPGK